MLIAQDFIWFASDADYTRLNLGSPWMLTAQDLILFRLRCWLHKTSSCFASDANHTGLLFDSICLDLHLWCQFGWDLKFFEDFDSLEFIFFLPEGLSKAFVGCKTLLHSAFLFQIKKHVSDAVCRVMYDCAWMKCSCIGFHFMFFFKLATFSPMHSLQACWCSLFLLCLRRYFCLDTCPSHRILFFLFLEPRHSCSNL